MTQFHIRPSSVRGTVAIPPSKSHTLRAILFAAMAKGNSEIRNFLHSPDATAMIDAMRLFGSTIEITADHLRIRGLEPVVKNGAVHVLRTMRPLISEMEDYPYGSTVDVLDCLAFLQAYAPASKSVNEQAWDNPWTIDNIEKAIRERVFDIGYPFSPQLGGLSHAFSD